MTPLNNLQIDNPQDINSSIVGSRWANKIIEIVTSQECVRLTSTILMAVGSSKVYTFFSEYYPIASKIFYGISPIAIRAIDEQLIASRYNDNSSENQENSNGLTDLNNQQVRSTAQMIIGNNEPFATKSKPKTRALHISYNELTELPSGCHYNNSDICNITMEFLEQGDTVCCDTYLYSFKALKLYYEKHMGNLIPHNRQPLDWNKVYKLSAYGVDPDSLA
jgi:hypothetical protein